MTTTEGKCPVPGCVDGTIYDRRGANEWDMEQCPDPRHHSPSEAPSVEGPYKHTWDAGIKRHVLSGPGIDSSDERYHFGLRLEVEPIADDLNFAFVQGAKSREAEIEALKAELQKLRTWGTA